MGYRESLEHRSLNAFKFRSIFGLLEDGMVVSRVNQSCRLPGPRQGPASGFSAVLEGPLLPSSSSTLFRRAFSGLSASRSPSVAHSGCPAGTFRAGGVSPFFCPPVLQGLLHPMPLFRRSFLGQSPGGRDANIPLGSRYSGPAVP